MVKGQRVKTGTRLKIAALAVALVIILVISVLFWQKAIESGPAAKERTFFSQFVTSGGPIVWFVLLPLSVVAIYLTIDYCLTIRKSRLLPADCGAEIIRRLRDNGYEGLVEFLKDRGDLVSVAILRAIRQVEVDRRQVQMQLQMQNVIAEALNERSLALMRRIEWTNIIGNVSPMIGLFGTVFGMIKLFNGIVLAGGQPRPDQMADGISVALVTTFWGLLIAIPALAVYGVFRNRIESIANEAALQAEMILVEIKNAIENRITGVGAKGDKAAGK